MQFWLVFLRFLGLKKGQSFEKKRASPFFKFTKIGLVPISFLIKSFLITWTACNSQCSNTGCSDTVLDILSGYYDKYTECIEKTMVNLFSVHAEISFYNNKPGKITEISYQTLHNRNQGGCTGGHGGATASPKIGHV